MRAGELRDLLPVLADDACLVRRTGRLRVDGTMGCGATGGWVDAHLGRAASGSPTGRRRLSLAMPPVSLRLSCGRFPPCALAEVSVGRLRSGLAGVEGCSPRWSSSSASLEPMVLSFLPDVLEAIIVLGELDRAETLLDMFESRGRGRLYRVLVLCYRASVAAGCCSPLEATPRVGGMPAAGARRSTTGSFFPFDLGPGRLLVIGVVERRSRRRAAAGAARIGGCGARVRAPGRPRVGRVEPATRSIERLGRKPKVQKASSPPVSSWVGRGWR